MSSNNLSFALGEAAKAVCAVFNGMNDVQITATPEPDLIPNRGFHRRFWHSGPKPIDHRGNLERPFALIRKNCLLSLVGFEAQELVFPAFDGPVFNRAWQNAIEHARVESLRNADRLVAFMRAEARDFVSDHWSRICTVADELITWRTLHFQSWTAFESFLETRLGKPFTNVVITEIHERGLKEIKRRGTGFLNEAHRTHSEAGVLSIYYQEPVTLEESLAQYRRMHPPEPPIEPPPPGWEKSVPAEQLERAKALLPKHRPMSPAEFIWRARQPARTRGRENRRQWIRYYLETGEVPLSVSGGNYMNNWLTGNIKGSF